MTDVLVPRSDSRGSWTTRHRDMGDGSHGEVGAAQIDRRTAVSTLTIEATEAVTDDVLDFRAFASGIIMMPDEWTAADIGFRVCDTADGTFLPLYNEEGDLVQIASPQEDRAYSLPPEVFAAHYVRLWSQDAGADEAQAAERVITLTLKA